MHLESTRTMCKLQLKEEKNVLLQTNKTNRWSTGSAQSSKKKQKVHVGLGYRDIERFMVTRSGVQAQFSFMLPSLCVISWSGDV